MIGSTVRWGVAGCGWVARDYALPALVAAENCEVVALLDPDPVALAEAGRGLGAARYEDPEAFFAEGEMDAVYVATPNHLHAPVVEAAAAAGKHVMCEKPVAPTLAEARRMVAACEAAGVTYATAFDQRYHAAHRRLRGLVEEGKLGTVCSARIHYACWLPPGWAEDNWRVDPARAGGGAFVDLAPHGLDLLSYLLGEEIVEVSCLAQRRVFGYPVEDGAALVGRTATGTLVIQHVAYNTPDAYPRRTLEIVGTEAMVIATNTMGQTPGGTLEIVDPKDGTRTTIQIPPEEDRSPFLAQVEAFSASLLGGGPFPFSPRHDLHVMGLMESAMHGSGAFVPETAR
ncbi:MAG: Glucose-fructose oxidoreductase [uncultured Rubrobacteraceae bacterium]|uniref:Glucose-fructose oxidoreductase n=1 Tax=uncultured Rubrobacteraceae bacterium TaxID=349277 RepID=A0A6J4QYH3_9ACTN|nr:MAG: Glucose-fructose oxidoreductase [uncultured Rubrobacteraceae bacterium]